MTATPPGATMCAAMRAANLHAPGDLRAEMVPRPRPQADEALIRIEASGICGSDVDRVLTKGTYHFPTIPGHEFAGAVVECPADKTRIGQRVCVFPLIACRRCPMCEIGEYASCADYDYYGSRRDGGFAQFQAVKLDNLVPVGDDIAVEDAAMVEPCAVAVHALAAAPLRLGDRLAVWGAGPIGLMAAQLGAAQGARVAIFDVDDRKLELARRAGFGDTFNPRRGDPAAQLRATGDARGADVCLEASGAAAALAGALAAVRPFGHIILMGNPVGDMTLPRDAYWTILRRQVTCVGVWNSARNHFTDDWRTAIEAIRAGQVTPSRFITHRFDLTECAQAFAVAADPAQLSLKIMFTPSEEPNEGRSLDSTGNA
ncbi:MAG: alcohol dehydrogenase catalytic domain-containing protein [Bifidobacteriaceae bacterium]|jgi:L-iditol 2-dehydrogenase|nr:alcohol dehydrogenase catalytic domain-containing protein [Bifidobacteriaceae bacterium]